MNKFLRLLILILVISVPFCGQAQTVSKKAPARKKPVPRKTAPAPATPATSIRSNSTALPQTTPVAQPTPPPAAAPQRPTPSTTQQYTSRTTSYKSKPVGFGFQKGDNLLNIGVGLSSYYYGNPIGVSYESGISDDFSIGAQFDYNSGRYDDYYGYSYRYRYSAYYLGVRGSYHFNRILHINEKKVDLYAGLGLGYQSFKWNDSYYGSGYGYNYGSGLFVNYFIGGKYYFTDKVGAFIELGYTGLSSSRVGLLVKF